MSISYRALNAVTRPFQFLIGRFSDTLDDLSNSHVQLWLISLDARSGYHQVSIRVQDQEKLAFLEPDSNKYC